MLLMMSYFLFRGLLIWSIRKGEIGMSEEQRAFYIFLLLVGSEEEADRFREACRTAGGDAE